MKKMIVAAALISCLLTGCQDSEKTLLNTDNVLVTRAEGITTVLDARSGEQRHYERKWKGSGSDAKAAKGAAETKNLLIYTGRELVIQDKTTKEVYHVR